MMIVVTCFVYKKMTLKPTSHDLPLIQFKFTLVEDPFMFDNRLGT